MTRLFLFVLAACTVAGCDLPSDPVLANPYDPLSDGPRIATSPSDLTLVASTPTTVDLSWTDRSSFETSVQVQRRSGTSSAYRTLATLPANATSYTDTDFQSTSDRSYRIVALVDGGRPGGEPSEALDIQFVRRRAEVNALEAVSESVTDARFSEDGTALYTRAANGIWAVDAQSGALFGQLSDRGWLARVFGNGRAAIAIPLPTASVSTSVSVRTYDRAQRVGETIVQAGGACSAVVSQTVRVSEDGQAFVALCTANREQSVFATWGPGGGAPRHAISLPVLRGLVIDLSPDGTRAVVAAAPTSGSGRDLFGMNVATGAIEWTTREDQGADFALSFSPDSRQFFDSSSSETRLRASASAAIEVTGASRSGRPSSVSFTPDGQSLGILYNGAEEIAVLNRQTLAPTFALGPRQAIGFRLLPGRSAVVFTSAPGDPRQYEIERYDFASGWETIVR